MFDLVIFDLDGTLVDTAPEISDAVNATLAHWRHASVSEAQVRSWIGLGTRELLGFALAEATHLARHDPQLRLLVDQAMPDFERHYFAACGTRSRVYRDVEHSLDALRALDVRLALATNKEERFTFAVLDRHRLRDYLDLVVCGDTLAAKKPDPLPLAHCMRCLGARAERTLFVGDSEIDVMTARNAQVPIWAVPYGYNHGRAIVEARPDRVIPTIDDVARCIGEQRAATYS